MIDQQMADWLLKQIDDDLMWAREASRRGQGPYVEAGVHWQWETSDDEVVTPRPDVEEFVGEGEGSQVDLRSREEFTTRHVGKMPQFAICQAVEIPSAVGGHIIRHDPARVIADLTARRCTVQRCLAQGSNGNAALTVFADDILRDMTEAYKERPGYSRAWRPYEN